MTNAIYEKWQQFWYVPQSSTLLGIQRVVFYSTLLLMLQGVIESPYAPVGKWAHLDSMFWEPRFPWSYLGQDTPPPSQLMVILATIFELSALSSCLGLFTRTSTALSAILGITLLSYTSCWGPQYHQTFVIGLVLPILALSPCGDAFSLDSLRKKREAAAHGVQYAWPSRLICVGLSLIFWSAGLSKLRKSGLDWILSENMSLTLTRAHYLPYTGLPWCDWALDIARVPWLCQSAAAATMVLELCYPLALLGLLRNSPRYQRSLLTLPIGGMILILGFNTLLGKSFFCLVAAHIFWIHSSVGEIELPPLRLRNLIKLTLFLVVFASGLCMSLDRSAFPFSYYPMYSWKIQAHLNRYCLYGVTDGLEVPLWAETESSLAPTNRWVMSLAIEKFEDDPEAFEAFLKECLSIAEANGHSFTRIRAYRCHWNILPGAPNIKSPVKTLLGEVAIPVSEN